ncbi:recombinase family protein [uncultured Lamprocystis sp.]|uniref:recombinase family protein n=1 Tax=uncultured Lamprocystis sp. TaxID=543132 RepID=UPI0025E0F6A1|nr:recombinase family protein [uncultured Lamprocystis sp.]
MTRCLKVLGEGDTLTVWKRDRLGRSLRDLIGLLDDLKARAWPSGPSLRLSTPQRAGQCGS